MDVSIGIRGSRIWYFFFNPGWKEFFLLMHTLICLDFRSSRDRSLINKDWILLLIGAIPRKDWVLLGGYVPKKLLKLCRRMDTQDWSARS